jgi:methionine synthase I (cobalamin-dependent)
MLATPVPGWQVSDRGMCMCPAEVKPFVDEGLVNALGGCCGSRPEHIAAIVKMASS